MGADNGAVKSADRALAVLELLAASPGLRFSEIADRLDLPRSSVHGLLATLVGRGFVDLDGHQHTYALGIKAWTIGQAYAGHRDLVGIAEPLMEELARTTGETIQLARLDGVENVYIAIADSPQPMKLVSAVGMRLPAYATGLGKALLAGLDRDDLRGRLDRIEFERFTAHTVADRESLEAQLDRVAADGYATDDEEYIIGCRCVAMPVRGRGGPVAAMSVSAPTPRCGPDWVAQTRRRLADTVAQVEQRLER
ncbi:MAG: helix-turn-helix domain-containing protein [Streptosporangiales bacterium]|nr:helix-turn-helix domain-containing protein [Streptosporangiales bacterium]